MKKFIKVLIYLFSFQVFLVSKDVQVLQDAIKVELTCEKASCVSRKASQEQIEGKLIKMNESSKFVKIESYADVQTIHLNRPNLQKEQEIFTLAEREKTPIYNAPDMNKWANDMPSHREHQIGTFHGAGGPISFKATVPRSSDPFRKPLSGPW